MSASKKKQQRLLTDGKAEREQEQAQAAQQAKSKKMIYTVIGVVVAILVIALLVWNTNIIQRGMTAATIGGEEFTVADVSFYYNQAISYEYSLYSQYGLSMPYDSTIPLDEQLYGTDESYTYYDYYMDSAIESLTQTVMLCREAEAAGYTLSAEGQADVDAAMESVDLYRAQNSYSRSTYLQLMYGETMTEEMFLKHVEMTMLATEYQIYLMASYEYSDSDLEAYYADNAADLDSYEYRYCFINATVDTEYDEAGNELEVTDEQTAAAMELARLQAEEMAQLVRDGGDFNTLAMDYVSEASAYMYEDAEYNHYTDTMGNELSTMYASWLQDDSRQVGDVGTVISDGYGYYVVTFLSRDRVDDNYESADVRHILVLSETEESEDGTTAATDQQMADAYAEAQRILTEWESGDATEASFAALAEQYSDDPGSNEVGGLYEGVTRSTSFITNFIDWTFESGRQVGDVGIVENTQSGSEGYHIMYLNNVSESRWITWATNALNTENYDAWCTETLTQYTFEAVESGLNLVK